MKYSISIIILFIAIQSFGQFTKGDMALGGSFSFGFQNATAEDSKGSSFSVSPNFGVLVSRNLEIGVQIGYSHEYFASDNYAYIVNERKVNNYSLGLYLQKYIPITDNFLCSISSFIIYSDEKSEVNISDQDFGDFVITTKGYNLGLGLVPSFMFFPSPRVAFRGNIGSLSYIFSKNTTDDEKSNSFSLNYYGSVGLGVVYYFRKEIK